MKSPSGTSLRARHLRRDSPRYHLWATRKLHGHIDTLSDADYRRDAGLFFGSVHGTCNHLLVAEHRHLVRPLRRGRLVRDRSGGGDRAGPRSPARAQRRCGGALGRLDRRASTRSRFEGNLDYTTTRGVAQSLPFDLTLAHVFNHATHHRGQITAAITAMGYPCPEIDMVWMLQEEGRAKR